MKREEFTMSTAASIMAKVSGLRIMRGHETDDGLHLELEGNQVLIFTGPLIVALYHLAQEQERLH